jgi:hypothetical protein
MSVTAVAHTRTVPTVVDPDRRACAYFAHPGRIAGNELIAEMSEDSISDGYYVNGPLKMHRDSVQGDVLDGASEGSRQEVFAQLAIIRNNVAEAARSKVALIWWQPQDSCEPWFPDSALRLPLGSKVYIAMSPRDPAGWINGVPTYDVLMPSVWEFYSPDVRFFGTQAASSKTLSAQEFKSFVAKMPLRSQFDVDRLGAGKEVAKWAEKNRTLANRYPVSEIVADANSAVRESMRRKGE